MTSVWVSDISDYLSKGGWIVMGTLVVAAMLLWYALGYRMVVLQRGNVRNVRSLIDKYDRGYSRKPRGVVDAAIVRGLAIYKAGPAHLRRSLDEAFGSFEDDVSRFAALVKSIVMVSPLLGLLGTVGGMIETFDSLGDMSLFSQSGGIAGGISQALFTTQMGLAVALPGLLIGRILERRQRLLEGELDKIKDILCTR